MSQFLTPTWPVQPAARSKFYALFGDEPMRNLFAGIADWPNLSDMMANAATRIARSARTQEDWQLAGLELASGLSPTFSPASSVAGVLMAGIRVQNDGFLIADPAGNQWAICSNAPLGADLAWAVSIPGNISVLDPDDRRRHRGQLERDYHSRSGPPLGNMLAGASDRSPAVRAQLRMQHTEGALRLLLQVASRVLETETLEVFIDILANAPNVLTDRDRKICRDSNETLLVILRDLQFGQFEFVDTDWRPRLIRTFPSIASFELQYDDTAAIRFHPETMDALEAFIL
jgi:hypothetical protein